MINVMSLFDGISCDYKKKGENYDYSYGIDGRSLDYKKVKKLRKEIILKMLNTIKD